MTEPTGGAATAVVVAVFASMIPGVNGDVLIGSFGGAVVYAVSATDNPVIVRLVYMVISAVIGYMGAFEVSEKFGFSEPISAFIISALLITATLNIVERVKTIDPLSIFKR